MSLFLDKSLIINEIKSYYKFTKDGELADFLGIKPNTLSNWKTRNTLDYELIITKCEDIDANWLLTGKGDMLKRPEPKLVEYESILPIHSTAREEPQPAYLKKSEPKQELKERIIVATQDASGNPTVPIINYEAAANYATGYQSQEYFENLEATILPKTITGGNNCVWVKVRGNSMEATYHEGDLLLCEYVERGNWVNGIKDTEVYVVVSKERGLQVKRIKNRLKKLGFLRCRSDNREATPPHPPFNLYEDDIIDVWHVIGQFTNYMPNRNEGLFLKVDYMEEGLEDLRMMYEEMKQWRDQIVEPKLKSLPEAK